MAMALTINSSHTKLWLQGLHKNIIGKSYLLSTCKSPFSYFETVVRHPDHRSIDNNVLFWSHHEVRAFKGKQIENLYTYLLENCGCG